MAIENYSGVLVMAFHNYNTNRENFSYGSYDMTRQQHDKAESICNLRMFVMSRGNKSATGFVCIVVESSRRTSRRSNEDGYDHGRPRGGR